MNVMLLSAGEGTRLRPYTNILPKPAMPFLTVPLAAHALSFLQAIEINKLVVNTYHLPEKIHELFHRLPHQAKELHFSDEQGEILGSGGGLGKARSYFTGAGDFIMMNADEVILPKDSEALKMALLSHKQTKALATLLVMNHPGVGTQFGGVWTSAYGRIEGFGRNAFCNATKAWHFVGVQILSERIFDYIPTAGASNILYDAVTKGISKGEFAQVFPIDCSWFETGNPTDFLVASQTCIRHLTAKEDSYQKDFLQKTLQAFSGTPFKIFNDEKSYGVHVQNSIIDTNVDAQGLFIVGSGSSIGPGCKLKNVIVGDNVSVPEKTEASDSIIIG